MDKCTRNSLIAISIVILALFGAYCLIQVSADVKPTFTVVTSQSMQHERSSQIGIIDTGDMVVLKNADLVERDEYGHLISYVEGSKIGFSSFGEYGTVVVYERDNAEANPIIHRLILWIGFDPDTGTWYAPSLSDYDADLWDCSGEDAAWNHLSGILTLKEIGYNSKTVSINLNLLASQSGKSGYLTMGDNKENNYFDQLKLVINPVSEDSINAVAWMEIPWGGIPKLLTSGKKDVIDRWVPNSIPSMTMIALTAIFSLFILLYI